MANKSKAADKVQNPNTRFAKPAAIVKDAALSSEEKKAALDTWEQDERQLLTASNEGVAGSEEGVHSDKNNRLDEVVKAKEDVGEKPKHKPSH